MSWILPTAPNLRSPHPQFEPDNLDLPAAMPSSSFLSASASALTSFPANSEFNGSSRANPEFNQNFRVARIFQAASAAQPNPESRSMFGDFAQLSSSPASSSPATKAGEKVDSHKRKRQPKSSEEDEREVEGKERPAKLASMLGQGTIFSNINANSALLNPKAASSTEESSSDDESLAYPQEDSNMAPPAPARAKKSFSEIYRRNHPRQAAPPSIRKLAFDGFIPTSTLQADTFLALAASRQMHINQATQFLRSAEAVQSSALPTLAASSSSSHTPVSHFSLSHLFGPCFFQSSSTGDLAPSRQNQSQALEAESKSQVVSLDQEMPLYIREEEKMEESDSLRSSVEQTMSTPQTPVALPFIYQHESPASSAGGMTPLISAFNSSNLSGDFSLEQLGTFTLTPQSTPPRPAKPKARASAHIPLYPSRMINTQPRLVDPGLAIRDPLGSLPPASSNEREASLPNPLLKSLISDLD